MKPSKFIFLAILFGLITSAEINAIELEKTSYSNLTESPIITQWFHSISRKYAINNFEAIKIKKSRHSTCALPALKIILINFKQFDLLESAIQNKIPNSDKRRILHIMEWTILHEIGHIIVNDINLYDTFKKLRKEFGVLMFLTYLAINKLSGIPNINTILEIPIDTLRDQIILHLVLAKHSRYSEERADKFAASKITSTDILQDAIMRFKILILNKSDRHLHTNNNHQSLKNRIYQKINLLLETHPSDQDRVKILEKRKEELILQRSELIKCKL